MCRLQPPGPAARAETGGAQDQRRGDGDIGCYDAGAFPPLELQSTIYCMGASIPMGSGIAHSGFDKPVFALIGDSTFFHSGLPGLVNAVHNKARLVVIVADNGRRR